MRKITKEQLFQEQAPSFNFEYGKDELLEIALERGYLTPTEEEGLYLVNENYGEEE